MVRNAGFSRRLPNCPATKRHFRVTSLAFAALIFTVKVRVSPSRVVASPVPSLLMPALSVWASAGLVAGRSAIRGDPDPGYS